jgi:hypothetical protein
MSGNLKTTNSLIAKCRQEETNGQIDRQATRDKERENTN